jgi:5-methyltetrahydrofolate--homocysteine methyltransferase
LVPYAEAFANRFQTDWNEVRIDTPAFIGRKMLQDFPLRDLTPYIDWSPFFQTWELHGKYPAILDDATVGKVARELFDSAQAMLERIIAENWIAAHGVYGFWPANSVGDDVVLYCDMERTEELVRFHMLRQQWERVGTTAYYSLADFIAPRESGRDDHLGAFAVTAGEGIQEKLDEFAKDHDDHSSILLKSLADRLAEAFAECVHAKARIAWGYGKDENLTPDDLIAEKYRGIRPAPGYPACPDHTEKEILLDLLAAKRITGIKLTETYAMLPAASVCGLYFAHPQARYFSVDRITRDQVEAYAARKGMSVPEVERWLAPNLGYEPTP